MGGWHLVMKEIDTSLEGWHWVLEVEWLGKGGIGSWS